MSKKDKHFFHDALIELERILNEQICLSSINDNYSGEEIAKIIRTICHIIWNMNLTVGYNLLPAILIRDTIKSFLYTIAVFCSNNNEKLRLISPALQHLLSRQILSQLEQDNISLDETIVTLLQKIQQFKEKNEYHKLYDNDLLTRTSVTMLNELPAKLRDMHETNTEVETILVQEMVQVIKMSLNKGKSVEQQQLGISKQLENMLTDQHSWTNDGFIIEPVTHEGIKAVIKDTEDKLNEIQNTKADVMQQQVQVQKTNSNVESVIHMTTTTTTENGNAEKIFSSRLDD
ncbi:unnamed protein product [Didymodactylos carnosus]|uniref:Uncharacterized protein n=1 Tax=Didymodactylos carnosus TaxID=1234261 RepID=A0A815MCG3_9BILA|nr:unnamed protein product [Didymodactylos carnosus]CAF1421095.1 unnamed protein product [Didymodactylos carnosus]CAF3946739.1 unnamed protein product [Didymodactylos carnosus]CAF4304266.1 unnamed protein product [Didymodactylos carnosus]